MALINCPECGRQVSDTAKTCPHCGYSIMSYVSNVLIPQKKKEEDSGIIRSLLKPNRIVLKMVSRNYNQLGFKTRFTYREFIKGAIRLLNKLIVLKPGVEPITPSYTTYGAHVFFTYIEVDHPATIWIEEYTRTCIVAGQFPMEPGHAYEVVSPDNGTKMTCNKIS